jgi:hypothetical protein
MVYDHWIDEWSERYEVWERNPVFDEAPVLPVDVRIEEGRKEDDEIDDAFLCRFGGHFGLVDSGREWSKNTKKDDVEKTFFHPASSRSPLHQVVYKY